jgi:hypothetical protein
MKYCNFIFILFLLVTVTTPGQDCETTIFLSADIENVEYYLNNDFLGSSKELISKTDTGLFIITAKESGNLWNPVYFSDTIHIKECGEYKFTYNFSSVKFLRTLPPDAYVYRNDSLIGSTPLLIDREEGSFKISKEGYQELEIPYREIQNTIVLERGKTPPGTRFYQKPLFKYLIGSLLVFGGVTAYYKLKADDKFEEYEVSGNEQLLKETRRYDLISGISFGALQVNLGFLLYYFMTE